MMKKIKKTWIWTACLLITCVVLVSVAFLLVKQQMQYREEDKNQKNIATVAASYVIPDLNTEITKKTNIDISKIVDINAFKEINSDTYGKVIIEGTDVDYLVMRSDNDEKYLHTDVNGNPSQYGSIYVSSYADLTCNNMLVSGHHMKNGKMFGSLTKYLDEGFREEHPTIIFISEDEFRIYTVSAAFSVTRDDAQAISAMQLIDDQDASTVKAKALRDGKLYRELNIDNQFITLVTCEYTHDDGRFCVIGELSECIPLRK